MHLLTDNASRMCGTKLKKKVSHNSHGTLPVECVNLHKVGKVLIVFTQMTLLRVLVDRHEFTGSLILCQKSDATSCFIADIGKTLVLCKNCSNKYLFDYPQVMCDVIFS